MDLPRTSKQTKSQLIVILGLSEALLRNKMDSRRSRKQNDASSFTVFRKTNAIYPMAR
jgi:hypothetical protein